MYVVNIHIYMYIYICIVVHTCGTAHVPTYRGQVGNCGIRDTPPNTPQKYFTDIVTVGYIIPPIGSNNEY